MNKPDEIVPKNYCDKHNDSMISLALLAHDYSDLKEDVQNNKKWRDKIENKLDLILERFDSKIMNFEERLEKQLKNFQERFEKALAEEQKQIDSLRVKVWLIWGGITVIGWLGVWLLDKFA